jgi:hypothetical protein
MIWHRVTHNFWWKLVSVLLAILLWYAVEGEPELVTSRALPLYFERLPADLLLTAEAPSSVRVEMRGPSGKLSPSSLSDAAFRLDLSPVNAPGERTFTLSSANLNLPSGVTFLRAAPSQPHLAFDRNLGKDVPVEIRFAGHLDFDQVAKTQHFELVAVLHQHVSENKVGAEDSGQPHPAARELLEDDEFRSSVRRTPDHPVRMRREVPGLRNFERAHVLQHAFIKSCDKPGFRICQFSIQGNHIHLICEATDSEMLARGIQGWSVRVARGLNGHLEREGTVFDDRYHAEILTTPSQTRNALCYVLQNARRHGEELPPSFNGMDPFSSAWWFNGWRDEAWKIGIGPPEVRTVAPATSWLLNVGWRRRGLLSIDEVPPAGRR